MDKYEIVETIMVDAAPGRVWELLTDPGNLPRWWDSLVSVEGEIEEGAGLVFDFGEHGRTPVRIESFEAPSLFAWRWTNGTGTSVAEGTATLVEFRLEARGERTFVEVRESGFEGLTGGDEARQELFEDRSGGWPVVLGWLSDSQLLES